MEPHLHFLFTGGCKNGTFAAQFSVDGSRMERRLSFSEVLVDESARLLHWEDWSLSTGISSGADWEIEYLSSFHDNKKKIPPIRLPNALSEVYFGTRTRKSPEDRYLENRF